MKAKDVMTTPVVTVAPDAPIKAAAELMVERDIGALPVVDVDGQLVGIVSEADVVPLQVYDARRHHLPLGRPRAHPPTLVREIMQPEVIAVFDDTDVADIARLMLMHRIRHVPIVDELTVIGMVARRDILQALARPDEEIAAEIRMTLSEHEPILGHYDVTVRDGVVYLTGFVENEAERLVESVARTVGGVVGVSFERPQTPPSGQS